MQTPFKNLRQTHSSIPTSYSAAQIDEDEEPEKDPPAPPYEPSHSTPTLSNKSYHSPAIKPVEEGPQYQILDIRGNPVNLDGTTAIEDNNSSSSKEEESIANLA
jgi:hypothetical protein